MRYNKKDITFSLLCSGRGSNLPAIVDACKSGTISATPCAIICSKADTPALEFAQKSKIPSHVLNTDSIQSRDESLISLIDSLAPDFIVLAGYIKKIPDALIEKYPGRILNVHPSLLPDFGGKGMYGLNVHKAVLEAGKKKSGLSIHLVDKGYDEGKILKQVQIDVLEGDTAESLLNKILELENIHYPLVIEEFVKSEFLNE